MGSAGVQAVLECSQDFCRSGMLAVAHSEKEICSCSAGSEPFCGHKELGLVQVNELWHDQVLQAQPRV